MKIKIPMLIQDRAFSTQTGLPDIENHIIEDEEFFLDGPVCKQIAVLDLDPTTGELAPGAAYQPPPPGRQNGSYAVTLKPDESGIDIYAQNSMQVSVFATVHATMRMFEEPDTLGRSLTWAFGAPQLLIIPRAGNMKNAFYERESHSLQFYYFDSARQAGQRVYCALSRDIVAHETGHAILDGIAPDLYHSITPQALALHEAISDLTAVIMALRSPALRKYVLEQTGGALEDSTVICALAEEFGSDDAPGGLPDGRLGALRNLANDKKLKPGKPLISPHTLSEVLSGALYTLMLKLYADRRRRYRETTGKSLALAAKQFQRMILRALDYLPPGEVSFADYGRAIIASDQASHPDGAEARTWVRREFKRRGIVTRISDLEVERPFAHPALKDLDLETLVASDWAAYAFANEQRELLRVPPHVPLRVRPRLDVKKVAYVDREDEAAFRECIFKVSWDHEEENPPGLGLPARRQITLGTTLAIDWYTKQVRSLLTSDASANLIADRDSLLRQLCEEGRLQTDQLARNLNGQPLRSVIRYEALGDLMRMRGTARMLHIAEGE